MTPRRGTRRRLIHASRPLAAFMIAAALASLGAWGAEEGEGLALRLYDGVPSLQDSAALRLALCDAAHEEDKEQAPEAESTDRLRRWFVILTVANAYPGLKSEELIDRFFNVPIRFIAPGFEDVNTFGDIRDSNLIWTPNLGLGYILSPKWAVFLELGYGEGPVRTKADYFTLLLFLLHTDFEMRRSAFTVTPGVDFFPWGMVEQRKYAGLKDRLRSIRPVIGVRVPWTYAAYQARIKVGVKHLGNIVDVKLEDSWRVWSVNMNAGVDVPITRRNQVNLNLGYSYFSKRDDDFGGPVFSVSWKYHF